MKKILMAVAALGFVAFGANAQTGSKYNKNFNVCMTNNSYQICETPKTEEQGRTVEVEDPSPELRMMDTYVHFGYAAEEGVRPGSRIRVTYDDPNAPYQGEESQANDGVEENIQRNINYLDQSVVLPANDGGNSNRD